MVLTNFKKSDGKAENEAGDVTKSQRWADWNSY